MATTQLPTSTRAWTITTQTPASTSGLQLTTLPLPALGPNDVLLRVHAASLNYRDLLILTGGYIFPVRSFPVIPLSDGSGTIVATGTHVTTFHAGDRVMTVFNQGHQHGVLDGAAMHTGLGGALHGVAAEYMVLPAAGVVRIPESLSFVEAATLPCAGVTAWNALYGGGRSIKAGESVLVQGSGGVSVFALQFAKAAGAWVFATTGSQEKEGRLKELGADVVVNYRQEKEWGVVAKKMAPGGEGIDNVVEVGGLATIQQSFKAVRLEGMVSVIGLLGATPEGDINHLSALSNVCTLRGIYVGNKKMLEDMAKAIEVNKIKPVVDERVFAFEELKKAYEYQMSQKHFGKVVVKFCD